MYDLSSMSAQVFLWKRKRRCIMINVLHSFFFRATNYMVKDDT